MIKTATVTSLGFNITAKWDGAGLKQAQAQLDNLKRTLGSIDGQRLRVAVDVDDSAARSKLEALKSIATNQTIHIGVDINDAALTQLRDTLDRFGHTRYVAQADVNTQTASLDVARAELERFGATHVTATADVDVSTAGAHLHELTADLGDTNNGFLAFRESANTASFASSAFSLAGLATVGVLAAIGPAAALAGTALVTGLGGGFVAVGALILSQNAQVKSAMVDLKDSVVSEMKQAADGMKGPLLEGIAQLKTGLKELEPAFAQAFTAAGPLIQPLVQTFLNFTNAVMPGVLVALKSAGPVFSAMAEAGKTLGAGLGDAFRGLAAGAQGFAQVWQVVGVQVGAIVGNLGRAMGQMASAGAQALNNILIGVNGLLGGLLAVVNPLIIPLGQLARAIGVDLGNALRLASPGLGQLVSALVDALLPVLNILLPVLGQVIGTLASSFVPVIQVLSPLLTTFALGLATILNFLRPILPILVPLVAGLWLLNAALLANPAVLIAAGIVLLVGALVELAQHWSTVWNGIKVTATTIWSGLQVAWTAFVNAMTIAWQVSSAALVAAWNATWNAMKIAAQAIWSALQVAWSAFLGAMSTAWGAFSGAMKTAWSGLWSALSAAWSAFSSAMKTAWSGLWSALSSAWSAFSSAMKTAWSALWSALSSAYGSFSSAMKTAWSGLWSALSSAYGSFSSAMKTAWNGMYNALSNAYGSFSSAMKTAWKGLWSALSSAFATFSSAMKTAWSGMWNAIKNTAESVWGAIKSGFKSFAGAVEDTLSGLVSKAKSIWNKIVDVFKTPVNAVIGIWDVVAGAVGLPKISKLADGGEVRGPGTSTSDSIPAMLSNGEFVVNAAAVSHYGLDHMYDLNSMRLAGGGLVGNSTVSNQNPGTIGGEKTNNLGVGVGLLDGVPTAMETAVAALGIHIPNPIDVIKKAVGGAAKAAAGAISDVVGFAKKNAGTLVGAGGILAPDALKFAKDITGDLVYDFAKPLVDAVVSKVPDPAPPGTPKPAGSVAHAGVKKIADSALGLLKDKQKIAVESQAVAGTKSVQAWAPTVMQALKMEGLPESWLGKILSMMQQESGGNPNAINRTDINAKNGVPSQGLMQVIPPTFAAYHWPGTSNNILDPLANIAAALNYIKHRYGYPPGSPYASGTNNATPGVHLVGENGPEMVLFGGGETVKNASETSTILGSSSAAAGGPPPNVANGPATSDKQLADSLAAWQNYMAQIQNISDTTWGEVSTTAAANWTDMQSNSDPFVTTMTKKFGDAGAAIQTKWAADLTAGTAATTASFDAQAAAASTFGTEIQKTYTDTAAAIETTWSQSLASSAAATTQYWTDVSGANASGTESLQTDLINPVSTMLTTQLPAAFNQSITAIGTGWENLKKTVRDPVAAVVDVVFNKGIVAMWNAIAGTFDAPTLDTFTMPAYATGGAVSGPGTGTSDSIMARLSHGEHVWTAAEVAAAGGHANVAALRSAALGGDTVRMIGANGRYADGGAVVGAPQGGTSSTQGATLTGDPLKDAANATLGSIKDISNPFITAAGDAGKSAIANLLPGTSAFGTLLNNAVDMMVNTVTGWITANDVLPTIGGANDAAAQAWADAQVGKPYALGGNFGATFDCSQYMSGIARAILGETPAPWFTTFAFDGDTAPTGFERGLTAPFMIGITNVGVGHTAGTLNGTNYEATPPAVRSGPSARGYDDPMFQDWYGFRPSIEASVGAVTDQNHLAIIDAAMAAAGVPPPDSVAAWEAGMNTIIIRESNWDPNAINNYDSNAAAGMPSQGLAQVIPPTFAAYHVAGTSNNILDPIANVAAAINYIVHTYGSIGNVQQANPNLPPKGYAHGTWGAQTGWHRVGEDGPEWVKFRGGEQVFPNGIHPGGGGETHVTVENHFHGPATKEAMQYAEGTFSENLRRAVHAGVGKKR